MKPWIRQRGGRLRSRAQEKVIGIREEDLGAGVFERLRKLGLDRGVVPTGMKRGVLTSLCKVRKVAARARDPVAWASRRKFRRDMFDRAKATLRRLKWKGIAECWNRK